jgi:VWFA-related protein
MKFMRLTTLALGCAVPLALAAQQELPAAPSATKIQQQQPAPPQQAAEAPETNAPSQPATTEAKPAATAPGDTPATRPQAPPAAPQQAPPVSAEDPSAYRFVSRVDEVNLIFTATDKRGRFVKNLTESDIVVRDDAKPPKSIVAFRSQTDLPLRVGLLIDASSSIRNRFRFEQEAAIEFLTTIVRRGYDKGFVLGFDVAPEIVQDFTDDSEKLANGVRMLRPGGGTAMYDAVYAVARDKMMKLNEPTAVRKAIILLSDGDDNQSRVTREEAIEMAQRAELIIYTISTNTNGYREKGDKVLERFAEQTGGRAFFPFKIEEVSNAFAEIEDELRSQYAVAYKPADFIADGSFRSIEIEPQGKRKDVRIRARKGYYAPRN